MQFLLHDPIRIYFFLHKSNSYKTADIQAMPPGYSTWQTLEQIVNALNGVVSQSELGLSVGIFL